MGENRSVLVEGVAIPHIREPQPLSGRALGVTQARGSSSLRDLRFSEEQMKAPTLSQKVLTLQHLAQLQGVHELPEAHLQARG